MKLSEIKSFLQTYTPTEEHVKLSRCETITNQKNFIKSHLKALESNKGISTFISYFNRLVRFVELMKIQKE